MEDRNNMVRIGEIFICIFQPCTEERRCFYIITWNFCDWSIRTIQRRPSVWSRDYHCPLAWGPAPGSTPILFPSFGVASSMTSSSSPSIQLMTSGRSHFDNSLTTPWYLEGTLDNINTYHHTIHPIDVTPQ